MAEAHCSWEYEEIFSRYQHFKQKSQDQSRALRRLRSRHREVVTSRDNWKSKAMAGKRQLARVRWELSEARHPHGHQYSTQLIAISLKLYLLCRCSLRGTVSVLRLFFGESVPCKSTISNWLRKAGYYVHHTAIAPAPDDSYSLIIDESMVVGQQRMLYGLLIEGAKSVKRALSLSEVKASFLAVAASWKADEVGSFLASVQRKVGSKLRSVICDTDTTLCKAVADQGLLRIRDVGHEMARFLRQTFERQEDFKAFTHGLTQVKFREIMKPSAYLLPPQARTQARFMNLSHSVQWAKRMLRAWPRLSKQEKETFAFLNLYRPLVGELSRIFDWINPLLKNIKEQGLSHEICIRLQTQLREQLAIAQTLRETTMIEKVQSYLKEEMEKIPSPDLCYHASSDIIESIFGLFKDRKSPNKLYGVTPSVLILSLRTKADPENLTLNLDVKKAMEDVSLKMIDQWQEKELCPNQVQRRIKTLKPYPQKK